MRLSPLTQAVALMTATLLLTACGDDADTTIAIIDGTPPLLTTDSNFASGYSAVAAIFVSGRVQDSGGIKSVTYTLNGKTSQPLNIDTNGYFNDRILLDLGENSIALAATDNAGNIMRSTKNIYLGDTVAAGGSHTAALHEGQLYGWGRNNYGQTGTTYTSTFTDNMRHPELPMLMDSAPKNLLSIKFNQNHSLAIDDKGQVYSWGNDTYGQLGRGQSNRHPCVKAADCRLDIGAIAGIDNAVMLAAGYNHNLVLTKDGSVWAFGANAQGQLGNNTAIDSSIPVKVDFSAAEGVSHIVQVVASSSSSYALDDNGQVWGWGSDASANLGRGQTCNEANHCLNITNKPLRINVIAKDLADHTTQGVEKEIVTQLAAGKDHVLALTNKESVYGWGLNASSQIGYNGIDFRDTANAWTSTITVPSKLPWFTGKDVRRVYANGNASYVLLNNVASNISNSPASDGILYAWGMFGETDGRGKTSYENLDEPTNKLTSLKNIDNMAMGTMHLIAHEKPLNQNNGIPFKNGNLFTWGWSFEGSLGNENTSHTWMYNYPIPVKSPSQL
ncbi:chromosome condensation regulator RCC1 [Psychrobacter glacincola]|uniref:RCC1 domain-containing protein n=1 Tax=Psychrobacter glacincola TaxID=56810 RepID=UPI003BB661C5